MLLNVALSDVYCDWVLHIKLQQCRMLGDVVVWTGCDQHYDQHGSTVHPLCKEILICMGLMRAHLSLLLPAS